MAVLSLHLKRPWAGAEAVLLRDSRLGPVVQQVGPCRLAPERPDSLYAALFKAIVYQQLNGRAAGAIFARVVDLFPVPPGLTPDAMNSVADDAMRAAGLSRGKLAAVRDLATRTLAGELPTYDEALALADDEVVRRLTVVRGIGPWTVQMLLIFNLGRPDVWPASDFGVCSAVQKLWRRRSPPDGEFMQRVGETWRPWRSVASWYLWRSHELPAGDVAGR